MLRNFNKSPTPNKGYMRKPKLRTWKLRRIRKIGRSRMLREIRKSQRLRKTNRELKTNRKLKINKRCRIEPKPKAERIRRKRMHKKPKPSSWISNENWMQRRS